MVGKRIYSLFSTQAIVIASLFGMGCGLKTSTSATTCQSGTAQISILDNAFRRDCGCTETAGSIFTSGQSLQCTVSVGTKVFFFYPGIQSSHQISGGGVIGSLPVHDPEVTTEINPVDVVTMSSTSSGISFSDLRTGISGTFIVQ